MDRLEHALACDGRLASPCGVERVAQVLRDVLQRPDVQMRCRVLDDSFQLGRDHLALSAAARPALRPNTQHSRRLFPIIRLRPCVPPAISPQAYRPSTVVSACSSITKPPFW